jgi:hypothetical protein
VWKAINYYEKLPENENVILTGELIATKFGIENEELAIILMW